MNCSRSGEHKRTPTRSLSARLYMNLLFTRIQRSQIELQILLVWLKIEKEVVKALENNKWTLQQAEEEEEEELYSGGKRQLEMFKKKGESWEKWRENEKSEKEWRTAQPDHRSSIKQPQFSSPQSTPHNPVHSLHTSHLLCFFLENSQVHTCLEQNTHTRMHTHLHVTTRMLASLYNTDWDYRQLSSKCKTSEFWSILGGSKEAAATVQWVVIWQQLQNISHTLINRLTREEVFHALQILVS